MVLSCVFCGSKQGTKGKTYHKFPLKHKEILQSWLQNMSLGSNFVLKKHFFLCSDHFEEKCFQENTNKKCLRVGSIPTLFGEYKSRCIYCHSMKGQNKKKSFHKFPLDNFALLEKWIAAIRLKHFIPNETSLLCNDHFDEKCFRSSGRGLVLKTNAVPTLFSFADSKGTSIKIQKNISNLSKVYDIKGNQLITQQPDTKRISSTYSTSSKIQKNDGPSTSIPIHSMRETVMDYFSVEHCDENVTPFASLGAEKGNNPVRNKIPKTYRAIKSRILHMKHDHQYATSPQMMKMQFLMQQRHILKRHVLRLRKKITSLKDNIAK